jgi:hypothetical protein
LLSDQFDGQTRLKKTFFRLIRKNKASSNETAAMVIKGDQNQDVSDHKEL